MPRVILDTDLAMGTPGTDIDDGFALALAVADPDIDLELVTTVNGNTDVHTSTLLTLDLLHRLQQPQIPVVKGAAKPLLRPVHPHPAVAAATAVRAELGHHRPAAGRAAAAIVEAVLAAPGEMTLISIAPLTNVALALSLEPDLAGALHEIVIMGGAFARHTNLAKMPGEFNIWVDPDAAAIVLQSGVPLRLVGLDVTMQVRLTRADADRLSESGTPFGRFAAQAAHGWIDYSEARYPHDPSVRGSCAMHDPLTVAAVSRPELLTWAPAAVAVERIGDAARGVTVADLLHGVDAPAPNATIATAVDVPGFLQHFLSHIAQL